MKTMTSTLLVLALAVGAGQAAAADTMPAHTPLRPVSECIRPDRINSWHIVDNRTAIVGTGPQYYQVTLQSDCPRLGIGPAGLIFRANESNKAVAQSQICGETGETVRSRDQPPCAIQSVSKIDKATFDALSKKATRHGSGADQPTTMKP